MKVKYYTVGFYEEETQRIPKGFSDRAIVLVGVEALSHNKIIDIIGCKINTMLKHKSTIRTSMYDKKFSDNSMREMIYILVGKYILAYELTGFNWTKSYITSISTDKLYLRTDYEYSLSKIYDASNSAIFKLIQSLGTEDESVEDLEDDVMEQLLSESTEVV